MYIILKNDFLLNKKHIIKILYDDQYENWVYKYLNNEKYILESNESNNQITYSIEENNYTLIKKEIKTKNKFFHVKKIHKKTSLFSLEIYYYNETNDYNQSNKMNEKTSKTNKDPDEIIEISGFSLHEMGAFSDIYSTYGLNINDKCLDAKKQNFHFLDDSFITTSNLFVY